MMSANRLALVIDTPAHSDDLVPTLTLALIVWRIVNGGSCEVLEASHMAEVRRLITRGGLSPLWNGLLLEAVVLSHELMRGHLVRAEMAVEA